MFREIPDEKPPVGGFSQSLTPWGVGVRARVFGRTEHGDTDRAGHHHGTGSADVQPRADGNTRFQEPSDLFPPRLFDRMTSEGRLHD